MEIAFTIVYILEASFKIIVKGLYQSGERPAYLRDPWNYIDVAIIFTG
jgi:hypothetical protein